jgi:nucleotide-binding universal stress UspA family protein
VPIKNIAVSVSSDSVTSLTTMKYAVVLARTFQAKIFGLYVTDEKSLHDLLKSRVFVDVEALEYERELEERGRHILDRGRAVAESKQVAYEGIVRKGVIHREIIRAIRECEADMLVMGELKEPMSIREIFYDEGAMIFYRAPCPVVVVKDLHRVDRLFNAL